MTTLRVSLVGIFLVIAALIVGASAVGTAAQESSDDVQFTQVQRILPDGSVLAIEVAHLPDADLSSIGDRSYSRYTLHGGRWVEETAEFDYDPLGEPFDAEDTVVEGLFAWNGLSDFVGTYGSVVPGATSLCDSQPRDGQNVFGWGEQPDNVLGVACWTFGSSGNILEADILFDPDWNWSPISDPTPNIDLFTVAVHEFGHAIGLGHTQPSLCPGQVMCGSYSQGSRMGPQSDDIAGLIALYGEATEPTPTPTSTSTPEPTATQPEPTPTATQPTVTATPPTPSATPTVTATPPTGETVQLFEGLNKVVWAGDYVGLGYNFVRKELFYGIRVPGCEEESLECLPWNAVYYWPDEGEWLWTGRDTQFEPSWTLRELVPGRTYFIYVDKDAVLTY